MAKVVGLMWIRHRLQVWDGYRPWPLRVNSLAPGKFEWSFRHVIFKQILVIDGWGICCEITLIWMSLDFTDDQSTLVQVMAWCRQATSHYLNQCWPRSLSPIAHLASLGHNEFTMFGVILHGVTTSSVRRIHEHAPCNTIVSFLDFVAWLTELIKAAQRRYSFHLPNNWLDNLWHSQ